MSTSPIITNSGTATRMELEFTFQAICPSMSHSGRSEKRYIRAMPISPRAPATCSPARKNTSMSTAAVPSTMGLVGLPGKRRHLPSRERRDGHDERRQRQETESHPQNALGDVKRGQHVGGGSDVALKGIGDQCPDLPGDYRS